MGLFGAGSILGALVGGWITDRYGFYNVQIAALLLGGMFFILLGFQTTFLTLGICSFVQSMCNESFRPANSAAIAYYSTDDNKVRSYSLNRLAVNLGWFFGGLLGGTLAGISYHLLFWVDGFTNIAAALLLLKLIPASNIIKPLKNMVRAAGDSAYRDGIYLVFHSVRDPFCMLFLPIIHHATLVLQNTMAFQRVFHRLAYGFKRAYLS